MCRYAHTYKEQGHANSRGKIISQELATLQDLKDLVVWPILA